MEDTFKIDIAAYKGGNKVLLPLSVEIISAFSAKLGLDFADSESDANLCYANIPGLRAEFRQSFTSADLQHFIYAVLHREGHAAGGIVQLPYPKDAEEFWALAEKGALLKN